MHAGSTVLGGGGGGRMVSSVQRASDTTWALRVRFTHLCWPMLTHPLVSPTGLGTGLMISDISLPSMPSNSGSGRGGGASEQGPVLQSADFGDGGGALG